MMSLLIAENDKEIARINELERLAKLKKEQLGKKETRQKILLGAFLLDVLEKDQVAGLQEYLVANLDSFLTREEDKKLLKPVVDNVKKRLIQSTGDKSLLIGEDENAENKDGISGTEIEVGEGVIEGDSNEVTDANSGI